MLLAPMTDRNLPPRPVAPEAVSTSVIAFAGVVGAAVSLFAGGLLSDNVGGGEPLIALFPTLTVVSVRWGSRAGFVTLTLGVLGISYLYTGQPFFFGITFREGASLVTAAVGGGLILAICSRLHRVIKRLHATNEALTVSAAELDLQSRRLRVALNEQAHARSALEMSDQQFRVSFENAAVGKVQAEPATGRIIRVNQAFCDMLGYTDEELVGANGWKLTFPDDVAADHEAYQRVISGVESNYIREKRYVRSDGSLIWVRASLAIVRSPHDDTPLVAVAVVENINEQYNYKIKLEQAKYDLEQTLGEREEALRQRDLLLREVYHRVKNNLQVVDGLIMMQARQIKDKPATVQLQQTRDRIYALGLVHHQLMGSDDLRTFYVSPFLTELVDNLAAASVSQLVSFEVNSDRIKVDLDFAIPLGLIVTELVTNALKHAFCGRSGKININLTKDEDGKLTLTIADDGIGRPTKVDAEAGKAGLGMQIVAGLLSQIRGEMHRVEAPGTNYHIVFQKRDTDEPSYQNGLDR